MNSILLVAVGGAIGAVVRFLVSGWVLQAAGPDYPVGTFIINVVGSLMMGVLAGWLAFRVDGGAAWRVFLGTGVLGGFTTFSAFSLETATLIEKRDFAAAGVYSVGSVVVGVVALFIGLWLSRRVFA